MYAILKKFKNLLNSIMQNENENEIKNKNSDNKVKIETWLKNMNITDYVINEDLTVDVNGNVNISNRNLTEIPIKFNIVTGNFHCFSNNLTSLKNCFQIIKGNFNCSHNQLTNLEGCPKEVNGNFYCNYNKLTSLKGYPENVKGNFNCRNNKLTSLEGCPQVIHGDFNCSNNKINSFDFFPEIVKGKNFAFLKNNITVEQLINFNTNIDFVKYIYSDFHEKDNKEYFLEKIHYYKNIKKDYELLKDTIGNNNKQKIKKL